MDKQVIEKIEELWDLYGPLDCWAKQDDFQKDIKRNLNILSPCRKWLSNRNKLKNIKRSPDSYTLKHLAENDIKEWVPHSVFILSAFLEGFDLSLSRLCGDVNVVSTNIGDTKR